MCLFLIQLYFEDLKPRDALYTVLLLFIIMSIAIYRYITPNHIYLPLKLLKVNAKKT